jgi:hypothetical protein
MGFNSGFKVLKPHDCNIPDSAATMTSVMHIQSRREEEQMMLQPAKAEAIPRPETQDMYEARQIIQNQGFSRRDVSGETKNQAAGVEVDGKNAIL